MRKSRVLASLAVLALAAAGGGGWLYARAHNPLANARQLMARGDARAAEIELRNAVRAEPGNAEARFRLGTIQVQLGEPVAAEGELRAARSLGWPAAAISPPLAQAYLAQGKFDAVLAEFVPAGKPPAEAGPIMVARGLAEAGLGRLDDAQATLAHAERLTPDSIEPPLAAAHVARLRDDRPMAMREVDRALVLDPGRADALVLKARLWRLADRPDEALAALDHALARAPNLLAARLDRADLLLGANQDARARADVDAVLAIEPKGAMANYLRATLQVRAGEYAAADATLEPLAPVLDRLPRGYFLQAVVKFNLGQLAQAAAAADRALARSPRDLDTMRLAARVALAGGHPARAIEVLGGAADGDDADLLDMLGRAYTLTGQGAQAARSYERAVGLADVVPAQLVSLTTTPGLATHGPATPDAASAGKLTPAQVDAQQALVIAAIGAGDAPRALAGIERLRPQPDAAEAVAVLSGLLRLSQADLAGARMQLAAASRAYPDSLHAKLGLAQALVQSGQLADAEQPLHEVLARDPANPAALATLLPLLSRDHRLPESIAAMRAAHAALPGNVALAGALADMLGGGGQPKDALTVLDTLPASQANTLTIMAARARAQEAAGQTGESRATWHQILAANPNDRGAQVQLANLLVGLKDIAGARAVIDTALTVTPGDAELLATHVRASLAEGLDAALADAAMLRANPANLPGARQLRGDLLLTARRYAEAVAAYAPELAEAPSPALAIQEARALKGAGHADRAAKLLHDWQAANPDSTPGSAVVAQMVASLDIDAGRLDSAALTLEGVLAKAPEIPAALNNLAWIYQRRGDARAHALALRAYQLAPQPPMQDTLGWILVQQGDTANGLTLLRQASAQMRDDPAAQYHMAYALRADGQRDAALALLKPVVARAEAFAEQDDARRLLSELSAGN